MNKVKNLEVNYEQQNLKSKKGFFYKLRTKVGQIKKSNIARKKAKNDKFINDVLNDLQQNHNHSWYDELYLRNKDSLNDIALFYRGTEITYGEMFDKMMDYAKSLRSMGIGEESEIPICMSNTPEFVYLLGAANIVGAKVNVFAHDFDPEYLKEIIRDCNCDTIFVEDNNYDAIKKVLSDSQVKNIVVTSLSNSLTEAYKKYEEYDSCHSELFEDKFEKLNKSGYNVLSIFDFADAGVNYSGNVKSNSNLDTEFTVTYSSGTTSNRPKPIVHTNRSFITIGRCHDPEIQKSASMKKFTIQSNAPTFSNTDLICNISDSFMQGSKLALEPIYDGSAEFFIDSLLINDPTYVIATRSIWLKTFKKVFFDERYKNVKFKNLLIPFAVGEGLEPGEEKFINKGLRKVKAGINYTKLPLALSSISLAGGDCEHGGIFWQLFRNLQSKKPGYVLRKEQAGMKAFEMVEYAVLDDDGNVLPPYSYGRLVANSPCNMKKYKNNPEATEKFFIKDSTGKVWGDCSVYSYINFNGDIFMKGRIPKDKAEIPPFVYTDAITLDTKNILSCETIKSGDKYISHIEFQPECKNKLEVIQSALNRCINKLGKDKSKNLVFRIHNNGFATTHSGKRDIRLLESQGIDNSIRPIIVDDELTYVSGESYFSSFNDNEKVKTY